MAENTEEEFGFKELFFKYKKFWPYIASSIVICLSAAYIANQALVPKYSVESKILINEDSKNLILDLTGRGTGGKLRDQEQSLSNESVIIKSRPLAHEVLKSLDFNVEYYRQDNLRKIEIYKTTPIVAEVDWKHPQLTNGEIKVLWENSKSFKLEFLEKEYQLYIPGEEKKRKITRPVLNYRYPFGEWINLPFAKIKINFTGSESEGQIILKFRDIESLVRQYTGENLLIYPVEKTSSILALYLVANQPEKGRDYLNTLMDVFLNKELNEKNSVASKTVKFIDSQISGLSDSLFFIESKLEKFRSKNKTYNISSEGSAIYKELSDLEKALSQETFRREYYQNLQDYLLREDYGEIIIPSGIGIEDPILNTLIENLIALQSEKSRFLATQTMDSPPVREVSRKIKDLNNSIKEVLKNVDRNSAATISDLQARISRIERNFTKLPETEQNLLRIEREFSLNEKIYTYLMQRRAESAISRASNTASSKIIDDAVINYTPLSPKPIQNYTFAMILGTAIPISIIFLINFLNLNIKDLKELENKLKIPIIARIGNKKLKSKAAFNEANSVITEAFRSLRSHINYTLPKEKQLTVMLTSSISGEGKTFCSINLASVYSMSGKKTILVGCDMRKSRTFEGLDVSNVIGLSTYLSGQADDLYKVIQPTQQANLDVIMAGPVPFNPSELLNNLRFEAMMIELKSNYDVIILDTPPIGLVSEALDLIRFASITLYVIRYNYSKKDFIEQINKLKSNKKLNNLYAVINGINDKAIGYGGYGYGYFIEDQEKRPIIRKIFTGSKKKVAL